MKYTPGPWRWEINETSKTVHLVGGKPMFDLTIIQPARWGIGSSTLMVRDTANYGMNLLHKIHERRDWINPFFGRDHNASWCSGVKHPDMQLIESAPDLLEALKSVLDMVSSGKTNFGLLEYARSVIAKATGKEMAE